MRVGLVAGSGLLVLLAGLVAFGGQLNTPLGQTGSLVAVGPTPSQVSQATPTPTAVAQATPTVTPSPSTEPTASANSAPPRMLVITSGSSIAPNAAPCGSPRSVGTTSRTGALTLAIWPAT